MCNMFSIHRVERIVIFLVALNLYGLVMGGDDLKDDNIDRSSRNDRGGLWFGPRLGKRSPRLVNDENRQTFLRLLEAADALKYYYDQLSYESQADDPENKVTKKIIFTPKLGRSVDSYESVDFTPRLGRRLADDRVTPSDQDNYRPQVEQMDRNKYFSPRLGRTMNFSPRLGRELSYGYIGIIVSITSGHVLFAANVDEIRNLAYRMVPTDVANKLVDIVSQNNAKYNENVKNYYEAHYDNTQDVGEENDEYEEEEDEEFDEADNAADNMEPIRGNQFSGNREPVARQRISPGLEDENENPETIYARPPNTYTQGPVDDIPEPAYEQQPAVEIQRPTPQPMEVNLDDLVEKVRERLLDDFHKNPSQLQKLLSATTATVNYNNKNKPNENYEMHKIMRGKGDEKRSQPNKEAAQRIVEPLEPKPVKTERKETSAKSVDDDDLPEVDAEGNVRIPKDQRLKNKPAPIFHEVSLTKKNEKDSYEDYVTPKREDNIFVSEEAETNTKAKQARSSSQRSKPTPRQDMYNFKQQENFFLPQVPEQRQDIFNFQKQNNMLVSHFSQQTIQRVSISTTTPSIYDDSNETTTAEPDLKARTENLWFDYKDEPIKKVVTVDPKDPSKKESRKVKLGTMIPTRETYKMTSPNYYAQLPTVAEKYNFDEPIPEKDREKEDLKPIGNPPANINGKVKVK